jgi:hypothetical protein
MSAEAKQNAYSGRSSSNYIYSEPHKESVDEMMILASFFFFTQHMHIYSRDKEV